MDEERPLPKDPLYEPIAFVFTETIGAQKTKSSAAERTVFQQQYADILVPKY